MAANIGPITAKIVASAEGMTAGLKEARDKTKGSMMDITEDAKKAGKEAGSGWFETFKGVLAGNLATVAVTGAFSKLTEAFSEGNRAILEMGTAARKAGVDLAGLQAVAETLGGDVGKATEAMLKLQESVGKAIVEGADEPFEKLGLDAMALAAKRADEQILTISQAMESMMSPITRARVGVQLFGDQWKEVAELLEDGGKDLAETRKALDQFGAGFGENAFQAAKEANKVFRDLQFLAKGFYNQVGQAISPILAEFKAAFGSLADYGITFKGLKDTIIDAAEAMAKAGVMVYQAWGDTKKLTAAWNGLKLFAESFGNVIGASIEKMLGEVFQKIPLFADTAAEFLESAQRKSKNATTAFLQGRGWFDWIAYKTDLKAMDDAFLSIRQRAKETGDDLKKLNPFELWQASVDRLANGLKSPFDNFLDEARRIKGMLDFAEDQFLLDFVDRQKNISVAKMKPLYEALGKITSDLIGSGVPVMQFTPAMEKGTREAYSTILASEFRDRSSIEQLIARKLDEQLKATERHINIGKEAARAIDKLNNKLEVRTFP